MFSLPLLVQNCSDQYRFSGDVSTPDPKCLENILFELGSDRVYRSAFSNLSSISITAPYKPNPVRVTHRRRVHWSVWGEGVSVAAVADPVGGHPLTPRHVRALRAQRGDVVHVQQVDLQVLVRVRRAGTPRSEGLGRGSTAQVQNDGQIRRGGEWDRNELEKGINDVINR